MAALYGPVFLFCVYIHVGRKVTKTSSADIPSSYMGRVKLVTTGSTKIHNYTTCAILNTFHSYFIYVKNKTSQKVSVKNNATVMYSSNIHKCVVLIYTCT